MSEATFLSLDYKEPGGLVKIPVYGLKNVSVEQCRSEFFFAKTVLKYDSRTFVVLMSIPRAPNEIYAEVYCWITSVHDFLKNKHNVAMTKIYIEVLFF